DAFETVADYVIFLIVYVLFSGSIWIILLSLNLELETLLLFGLLVLIPALLPASIAHRYWLIWKLGRETTN
ncbi:MAG: hypothetical protein ACXAB2_16225, partial [Candidatus Hodarchaeales archaeon]